MERGSRPDRAPIARDPATGLTMRALHAARDRFRSVTNRIENRIQRVALRRVGAPHARDIFTHLRNHELNALHALAAACPRNAVALEIGSYLGASTCFLAAGLHAVGGRLICVDTWQNETMPEGLRNTYADFCRNTAGLRVEIAPIRKASSELTDADIPTPLALAFIDADHSYAAVRRDLELVQRWLRPDGVIAFHDFGHPDYEGVSRVVGEALSSGEWLMRGYAGTLAWIARAEWSRPAWQ